MENNGIAADAPANRSGTSRAALASGPGDNFAARLHTKDMRAFALVLLLIFTSAFALLVENPHWIRVQNFQIELAPTSHEDLLFQRIKQTLSAQMKVYEGRLVWELPLKQIHELVSKDKRVKSVSVYREFPSKLRLEIEPHTPVLAYLARDGRTYPVARDATLLPALMAFEAPDLPILRGEELRDEPGLREIAIELLSAIPDEGSFRKSSISEILYNGKDGFKVFLTGASSEVKLGDTDFGPKVSRVQKVLSYLESQDIKGRVIDARFSKKVVVRVRNTP
jgi:cell division septal protein FtsQ